MQFCWDFPGGPVVKNQCFHCRGTGSIPGQGTKVPQAVQCSQKKKKKKVQFCLFPDPQNQGGPPSSFPGTWTFFVVTQTSLIVAASLSFSWGGGMLAVGGKSDPLGPAAFPALERSG